MAQSQELLIRSGFEPGTQLILENSLSVGIIGTDSSELPPNSWVDLWNHPALDTFDFQYKGGDSTMRRAELVPGPLDTNNTVLEFWIREANENPTKGRVQANVYNSDSLEFHNLAYSVKLFVPNDWALFTDSTPTAFSWLTLMEFWNNLHVDDTFGFRMTLNMVKTDNEAGPMHFQIDATEYDYEDGKYKTCTECWDSLNTTFAIPVGQWMRIDILFIEGDATNGRFRMVVTPEGGTSATVFDIENFTRHPDDPFPDGLTDFNPMKLYTSAVLIDSMRALGGLCHVYWDDFKFWKASSAKMVHTESESTAASGLKVYPNPTSGSLTFEWREEAPEVQNSRALYILDMQGRTIYQRHNIEQSVLTVDASAFPPGVYVYHTDTGVAGKFIVRGIR